MPILGYKKLAEIVSSEIPEGCPAVDEDGLRLAKDAGQFDLDDFASIVKYVAGMWGWLPPALGLDNMALLREEVGKKDKTIARLEDEVARLNLVNKQLDEALYRPIAIVPEEAQKIAAPSDSRDKWSVQDNYKPSEDPYLDRARGLRYPGNK